MAHGALFYTFKRGSGLKWAHLTAWRAQSFVGPWALCDWERSDLEGVRFVERRREKAHAQVLSLSFSHFLLVLPGLCPLVTFSDLSSRPLLHGCICFFLPVKSTVWISSVSPGTSRVITVRRPAAQLSLTHLSVPHLMLTSIQYQWVLSVGSELNDKARNSPWPPLGSPELPVFPCLYPCTSLLGPILPYLSPASLHARECQTARPKEAREMGSAERNKEQKHKAVYSHIPVHEHSVSR